MDFVLGFAIYTLVHGGILLVPGAVFWDDWLLFETNYLHIFETFEQTGSIFAWPAFLHIGILKSGIWLYKTLTFALMFAAGLMLYLTLERFRFVSPLSRILISLLFLALPFNIARVSGIMLPYTLCYFLFFSAWYLMERYRFLSLLLFVLSFNINSLLVFYALPAAEMVFRLKREGKKITFPIAATWFAFFTSPLIYFFIKRTFFPAFGLYTGYKVDFDLDNIKSALSDQLADFSNFKVSPLLCIVIFLLIYWPIFHVLYPLTMKKAKLGESILLAIVGILATFLAGFPYWILDLVPTFFEWSSRHQLLFPLGVATLLSAFLIRLPRILIPIVASIIVAASGAFFISSYWDLRADWEKQLAIGRFLAVDSKIEDSTLVIFDDRATSLNAIKRTYRFYEWNGLMELNRPNQQRRFGINIQEVESYRNGSFDLYFSPLFKAGNHHRSTVEYATVVTIRATPPMEKSAWGWLSSNKFHIESRFLPLATKSP